MSSPEKIYLGSSSEGAEVEIAEGMTYTKVTVTKSIQLKIAELDKRTADADFDDVGSVDSLVPYYCELYDLILKPLAPNRKKASTFVREQWDGDEISIVDLIDHAMRLAEVRPT